MTAPSKRIWFVRIEASGDTAAVTSNKLFRWTSAPAPLWDTDDLYKHCLGPQLGISGQSIEPRTGASSSGGLSFALHVELGDPHGVREIFGRHYHARVGKLSVVLKVGVTTIKIPGFITGAGTVVYVGREAILLGTYDAGSGAYLACTRGVLGTRDDQHRAGGIVYPNLKVKFSRKATLGYYDSDATGYGSEVETQSYQVHDIDQQGLVRYQFECDGLTAVINDAVLLEAPWIGQAKAAWGGFGVSRDAPKRNLSFTWQPTYTGEAVGGIRLPAALQSRRAAPYGSAVARGGTAADPSPGDLFWVSVNGTIYRATVIWFEAFIGRVSTFEANVDLSYPAFGGSPVEVKADDLSSIKIREAFVSSPGGAGNGGAGTQQLPLGAGGGHHPLTVWLQIVTSTLSGANGTHDVGIDFGLRMPASWIDFDSAATLIDTDPDDMRVERLFMGREVSKGEKALAYLDKTLFRLAGIQRTEGTDGRVAFTRITDSDYLSPTPVTAGDDHVLNRPRVHEDFALYLSVAGLTLTYKQDSTGAVVEVPLSNDDIAEEGFGSSSSGDVDAGAYTSLRVVQTRGLDYLIRWGTTIPRLTFSTVDSVNVRSGDSISLTSKGILGYDRVLDKVVEGVTNSRVLITSRTPRIDGDGAITYVGLHTGIRSLLTCQVAPTLHVTGANTGTSVPIVSGTGAGSAVGTDHISGYTDDTEFWTVGDSAILLDAADMSIKQSGLVVASLTPGTVVLTGLTATAASGDYIVPDTYAVSTDDQKADWEFTDQQKQYEG